MATQNPISTISYNSEGFLREKLEAWRKAHIVQSYMFIKHHGEIDKNGKRDKDHIHLRIEPNRRLDPMQLTEELKEWTKDNLKPLGVRPWRPSKEEDWILYAVHNPEYMRLKYGENLDEGEKDPYEWDEIQCDEDFDLEDAWRRALASMKHLSPTIMKSLEDGTSPKELIRNGENPFTVLTLVRGLYADNSYGEMKIECDRLKSRLEALETAIMAEGYTIEEDPERPFGVKLRHNKWTQAEYISPEDTPF